MLFLHIIFVFVHFIWFHTVEFDISMDSRLYYYANGASLTSGQCVDWANTAKNGGGSLLTCFAIFILFSSRIV